MKSSIIEKLALVFCAAALFIFFQNCSSGNSSGGGNQELINVVSNGANRAPQAKNSVLQAYELLEVKNFLPGLDEDGDGLTYSIVTQPTSGSVTLLNAATGEFAYTAALGAPSGDSFTFQVSDGTLNSVSEGRVDLEISNFSFFGSDRRYSTSAVLRGGAACSSMAFRFYVLGNSIFVENRAVSCGSTTYRMDSIVATYDSLKNVYVGGSKVGTITAETIQIKQTKYVSGCSNVSDTFSLNILNGKINFSEIITAVCGTTNFGTTLTAELTPGKIPLDLVLTSSYFDLGLVLQKSVMERVINIKNQSGGKAIDLSFQKSALVDVKGGVYPGTGGTCGSTLESLASCTIVVSIVAGANNKIEEVALVKFSDGTDVFTRSVQFVGYTKPVLVNPTKLSVYSLTQGCALDDGKVLCWGSNAYGEAAVPNLTSPSTIASGNQISCSTSNGLINCWGSNYFISPKNGSSAVEIAIETNKACSYNSSTVMCWGAGVSTTSELGLVPAVTNPKNLALGDSHACVIDDAGLKCWGSNYYNQLALPALVAPTTVSAGANHSCVIDSGAVKCWGGNNPTVTTVPALSNPRIIASSSTHNCVLDDNGVKCWGDSVGNRPVPAMTNVTHLTTGPTASCAIANKELFCW